MIRQVDADRYESLATIPTVTGARTSIFIDTAPEGRELRAIGQMLLIFFGRDDQKKSSWNRQSMTPSLPGVSIGSPGRTADDARAPCH